MSESRAERRAKHRHEGDDGQHEQVANEGVNEVANVPETIKVTIGEQEVMLPRKFTAGMPLTDTTATILETAYIRQFTNNQNAYAKARAEKNEANDHTPDVLTTLWAAYEPNVGAGGGRATNAEKLRYEAGWRAWCAMVNEHNVAVRDGDDPVIVKAAGKIVPIDTPPRKARGADDAQHKAVLAAWNEQHDAFVEAFLNHPAYAARVQAALDAIMAERGAKKDTDGAEQIAVTGADLL